MTCVRGKVVIIFNIVIGFADLFKYYYLFIIHSSDSYQYNEISNSIIYSIVFFISRAIVFILPGEDTLLTLILGIRGLSYVLTDSFIGLIISVIIAFVVLLVMMKWKTKIKNRYGYISEIKYYIVLGLIVLFQII